MTDREARSVALDTRYENYSKITLKLQYYITNLIYHFYSFLFFVSYLIHSVCHLIMFGQMGTGTLAARKNSPPVRGGVVFGR